MNMQLVLVRHGQTAWNREERARGQADIPLDETGRRQAQATGKYVAARWPVAAVYTSPLSRARETGEALAAAQGLTASTLPGLLDINYGEWQGVALIRLENEYPNLYRQWREAPHTVHFPGGEGLDDVRARGVRALNEVVDQHQEETVALVGHTVVNRVLLCAILDLGNDHFWHLRQDTCAVNVIEWDGERYRLALMNDTSHLWGMEQT